MISWWFVWTLVIIAVVSALLGVAALVFEEESSYTFLILFIVMGGAVAGLVVAILGPRNGITLSLKAFVVTIISGMAAGACGPLILIIVTAILGLFRLTGTLTRTLVETVVDTAENVSEFWSTVTTPANRRKNTLVRSEEHIIEQSFQKQHKRNRAAYISLFLALAEEAVRFFTKDTSILWVILTVALIVLNFINQNILTYRDEHSLYGTSYAEAKETVTLISKQVDYTKVVITEKEVNNCLRVEKRAKNKLDTADRITNWIKSVLNMLLIYNPHKTAIGVLIGVVLHTVYENVPRLVDLDFYPALPMYFWIAFGILLLNFRNLFTYNPKKMCLGVLLGVVLHTVYENVTRFFDLDFNLNLPMYFWIAFGILLLYLFNLLFGRRSVDKELENTMRILKKAQKAGHFTESERRQQWRNFIALVNQKALESVNHNG